MDFNWDAVLSQAGDDLVAGGADVVGVLAAQGREALDEGPGLIERDVGEGGGDFGGEQGG
jgi:hypothetical protein